MEKLQTSLQTRMQAIRKNDKKGFTLVELIVVLVILAILMAILIPSFTGYIAKARETAAQLEARTVVVGLKSVIAEDAQNGKLDEYFTEGSGVAAGTYTLKSTAGTAEFTKYTELDATAGGKVTAITVSSDLALTEFKYETTNGTKLKYADGKISKDTD